MATFNGTEGNDTLIGGSAADDLHGFGGNDFMQGGDGADTVLGGSGNDTMSGNAGNDWVRGGTGNDQVSGGGGQDSFAFADFGSANADVLTDFSGSWDNIQLDLSAFTALGATGRFASGDARFFLGSAAHDADDRIIYNQATGQLWYDADGNGAGSAQLIATLSNRASLSATDIFVFQSATPPPPPSGTINGTSGNDSLVGTAGNDTINGFGGDDTIDGRAGVDSMVGGSGDDLYYVDNPGDTITEFINEGIDEVRTTVEYTLPAWTNNLTIIGNVFAGRGNEVDNLIVGSNFDNGLTGYAGNDTILGLDGFDGIDGGEGNDSLSGGNGDDTFYMVLTSNNFGNDTIDGGAGRDTISFSGGGTGPITADLAAGTLVEGGGTATLIGVEGVLGQIYNDRMYGNSAANYFYGSHGSDTLDGAAGDDGLQGGDGNDSLIGGDGNDEFRGNEGDDTMLGGAGSDTFHQWDFTSTYGNDLIDGGAGFDTVRYDIGMFGGVQVDLGAGTSQGGGSGGTGTATLVGIEAVTGSGFGDSLIGGAGSDRLDGSAGDDTLFGGADSRNDTLVGGSGTDWFRLDAPGSAIDTLADFTSGTDKLVFDGLTYANTGPAGSFSASDERFYAGTAAHDASDRVIFDAATGRVYYDADGTGAQSQVWVASVASLQASDVSILNGEVSSFLMGTEGDDSIVGTAGDDTILGLGGNDTLDGRDGDDSLEGGAGNDSLLAGTGANVLVGGDGNDSLFGGFGDTLRGGLGDDSYFASAGAVIVESGGIDTQIAGGSIHELASGVENLTIQSGFLDVVAYGNELDNVIRNQSTATGHIDGADGNDTLIGGGQTDDFGFQLGSGNIGNDVVDGGGGFNMMSVGAFSAITADFRTGTVTGGGVGGSGSIGFTNINAIYAGNFNDRLTADDLGRTLSGGGGSDTLTGGAGNDVLIFSIPDSSAQTDILTGGAGTDIVSVQSASTAVVIDLAAGTLTGGAGQSASLAGIENASGSMVGDRITGNAAANLLHGSYGNDTLNGGAGNDTLDGGGPTDGADGDVDTFVFTVAPGAANADLVQKFLGGEDKIVLDGAVHANSGPSGTLAAGDGRFYAAAGANAGHDADDRIVYNTSTGQLWYDADGSGAGAAQLVATLEHYSWEAPPTLNATDISIINGTTPPPPPGITGTEGNDTLTGTNGNDTINGLGGNDSIQALDGADTVLGGAGNDTMTGNTGVDWVEGGVGNDRVTGGSGTDAFVFREFGAANADTITDFGGNNWDSLRFDNAAFTALGGDGRFASGDARFRAGTAAQDADDRIVFNSATGQVWYDADGNGAGAAQLVATLQAGATLLASDIWVV